MPPITTIARRIAFVLLFISFIAEAQEAESVSYVNITDKNGYQGIQFSFSVVAEHQNIPCFVRVKYTTNTRQFYLTQVKGDVGNLVYPGPGKFIVWDYQEELIHNTSADQVTITIEVFPNLSADPKVKKGKNIVVNMDDVYEKGKFYSVKLYRKEKEVATLIDSIALQHHFVARISKKTKAGKDYQIAVIGDGKTLFTNSFRVKPRVSTFLKVLPFIAVPAFFLVRNQLDELKPLPGMPNSPTN